MSRPTTSRLAAQDLTLAYEDRTVVEGLDLEIPDGKVTVVVGPNACGKSTLLRALGRLLKPRRGAVLLDGAELARVPGKQIARTIGVLPQSPRRRTASPSPTSSPAAVSPIRSGGSSGRRRTSWPSPRRCGAPTRPTSPTARSTNSPAASGSGCGSPWHWPRTRTCCCWRTTTYLDIAHQVEVLDLVRRLNHERGRTVVAVLHDLNQAARYADHLVAMKAGHIVAQGRPDEVVTAELVEDVFGLSSVVVPDPVTGGPLVVPARAWQPAPLQEEHTRSTTRP